MTQTGGKHYTALLSDLCSGSYHALHPEVRAHFPVSALDYASSPTRNVVLAPIPPGDGTGLQWIDTGSIGIVGVYDPALMTRDLALTVIERQSGKTPVDITTDEAVATVIGRLAGAR